MPYLCLYLAASFSFAVMHKLVHAHTHAETPQSSLLLFFLAMNSQASPTHSPLNPMQPQ